MRITFLGHAGLHIQTQFGSILCDPWKNPAYFDSWFVFPDNSELDWDRYGQADYLYVSHLHKITSTLTCCASMCRGMRRCCCQTFRPDLRGSWSGWALAGSA